MGKKRDKAKVSRTPLIQWHAHQNDPVAVRKLLEKDRSLVQARYYDNRTRLHVASLHGWIEVTKCLIEYDADVNAQDRWKNTVIILDLVSILRCIAYTLRGFPLLCFKKQNGTLCFLVDNVDRVFMMIQLFFLCLFDLLLTGSPELPSLPLIQFLRSEMEIYFAPAGSMYS
ncbi:hypothetical protein L1887_28797 [Cichorium endivia]|nr:hypothetical protein L1887_28797 [Cichorium endivia]